MHTFKVYSSINFDKCMQLRQPLQSRQNISITLQILCSFALNPCHSWPLATMIFTVSIVLPFREGHLVGITQYVAFSDWLLSLIICFEIIGINWNYLFLESLWNLSVNPSGSCTIFKIVLQLTFQFILNLYLFSIFCRANFENLNFLSVYFHLDK